MSVKSKLSEKPVVACVGPALIEELESQDQNVEEDEDAELEAGAARTIPEEMLQTSTRTGLSSSEVTARRKKYGMNQMKEEKENLVLKFLGFFIGPIQFVMEVSVQPSITAKLTLLMLLRLPPFSLPVSRIGSTSVSFALFSCLTLSSVSFKNTKPVPSSPS